MPHYRIDGHDYEIDGNFEDGYKLRAVWGTIEMASDGNTTYNLQRLRSVGVSNLCDVHSHSINRIANSTSHVIHLAGGGLMKFAYNDQGKLLELSGSAVTLHLDENGSRLSVEALRPKADQGDARDLAEMPNTHVDAADGHTPQTPTRIADKEHPSGAKKGLLASATQAVRTFAHGLRRPAATSKQKQPNKHSGGRT